MSALAQEISAAKGESWADDREPSAHWWLCCREDRARQDCIPSGHRSAWHSGTEIRRRLGLPCHPQGVSHAIHSATLATQPPSLYMPGSAHRTGSPGCHPNAVPSQLAPDADQATRACAPDRADCGTEPCNRCPRLAIPEYSGWRRHSVQARAGDGHRWGSQAAW